MSKNQEARMLNCAIYTRKSTEEGLDQDFQYARRPARIGRSLHQEPRRRRLGLPGRNRYDDGGYTGGNMERPALKALIRDIEAGKVNCLVVYKVDRLSRSLMDFAKMLEVFERKRVAFVSVTSSSTDELDGRLMLNVLLSFAQFERELISERTRDKDGGLASQR